MADRRQQPFRFWFPYWQRPPVPTQQRTPSRVPTSAPSQPSARPRSPPQSSPQPSQAAAATPSQPQSPSPTTARRSSQPPSPSPSLSSSPSRRSSRLQPSPSRPASKPPSPSKAASQRQPATSRGSPQASQPTETSSEGQPATPTSQGDLQPQTTTPERAQPPSPLLPSASQPELPPKQPQPSLQESKPEAQLPIRTQLEEQNQTQPGSQPKPIDVAAEPLATTPIKSLKSENQTQAIRDEKPEDIRGETTDLEPKQDTETSQLTKPGEKAKEISEKKHKPTLENKKEMISTETLQPDSEPKQHIEASPVSNLYEKPEEIPEKKTKPIPKNIQDISQPLIPKPDLETKRNMEPSQDRELDDTPEKFSDEKPKPTPEKKENENPIKVQKSETMLEKFKDNNLKSKPETQEEKPQTRVSEEPHEKTDPMLSILVSESDTINPHPKTSEMTSEIRITKPEGLKEQADENGKEFTKNGLNRKESKIAISTVPRDSFSHGERANFQEELKEGLNKLVQKLSIGHSKQGGNEGAVSIITLAGENKGASMFIGDEATSRKGFTNIHMDLKHEKDKLGASNKERSKDSSNGITAINASINSNVQGINNSVLQESSSSEKNPGVHLILSTKPTEPVSFKGGIEPLKTQKVTSNITQAQKHAYEPNIRRRCLRGLFMEPSEDDIEDPQKPRRHGCRFTCDEKKKGKAGDDGGTSKTNSNV